MCTYKVNLADIILVYFWSAGSKILHYGIFGFKHYLRQTLLVVYDYKHHESEKKKLTSSLDGESTGKLNEKNISRHTKFGR